MRIALLALALAAASPALGGELVAVAPKPVALTVTDRDGREHRLPDAGGRLTLLHFWASWCGSCREEFPAIDALQRDMRADGLRVAAVSLDRMGWPVIERTVAALAVAEVAVFHDRDREAARTLGVTGLPTTLVVDADGREVARVTGAGAWSDEALRARLRDLGAR